MRRKTERISWRETTVVLRRERKKAKAKATAGKMVRRELFQQYLRLTKFDFRHLTKTLDWINFYIPKTLHFQRHTLKAPKNWILDTK
jgi:hypothetical protein